MSPTPTLHQHSVKRSPVFQPTKQGHMISVFITLMNQGVTASNRNVLPHLGHLNMSMESLISLSETSIFSGWSSGSLSPSLISLLSEKEHVGFGDKESI